MEKNIKKDLIKIVLLLEKEKKINLIKTLLKASFTYDPEILEKICGKYSYLSCDWYAPSGRVLKEVWIYIFKKDDRGFAVAKVCNPDSVWHVNEVSL